MFKEWLQATEIKACCSQEPKLSRSVVEAAFAMSMRTMTRSSNGVALIREAQAARVRAHIHAMLSRLQLHDRIHVKQAA